MHFMVFPLLANGAPDQAAFFRFFSSQPSTTATVCTRRSVRSMLGAPLARARAAEDGVRSESAALAYFSNGTSSFSFAPRDTHSFTTQLYTEREASRSLCTASLMGRMPSFCTQR